MLSLSPLRTRRLSRPNAPSCRGGASSLLRLAQPGQRASGDLGGWMHRAAAVLAPAAFGTHKPTSIITLLSPSRELAARS